MKRRLVGGAIGVLTLVGAVIFINTTPAQAFGLAQNVALIPGASPTGPAGGTIPTSGYPATIFPVAPTFTNLTPDSLTLPADPLNTGGFDTAILVQLCDIGGRLAAPDGLFKSALTRFVTNGGKLLIWDSNCPNTSYASFVFPFHTLNPGLTGVSGGAMTITEQNSLGNSNGASQQFVDPSKIASTTNGALNANQFFSTDSHWCVSMSVANANGANGGAVNYATLGSGLIVWSGLAMNNMQTNVFTPANDPLGPTQLNRVLMNQLAITDTSTLKCTVKAQAVVTLTPKSQTQVAGQTANLSAHLVSDGVPVPNVTMNLQVTSGPDVGLPAAHVNTNANGDAAFTYVSSTPATNTLTASILAVAPNVTVSDTATVTWTARAATTQPVNATPSFTG